MIVDVWVRVCCATGVTTVGEEVPEVGVNEAVDEVADEIADEVADEAVDEAVDEDEVVGVDVLVLFKRSGRD